MELERKSPIPLYHQLSEAIRYRIATGEIRPGDRLPSIRAGAGRWGVNMHTVRRAYRSLEQAGLLRADRTGTVVRDRPQDALEGFLESVVRRARHEFGLPVPDLQRRLSLHAGGFSTAAPVHVVECSETQAADLAAQLTAAWGVQAAPWSLERPGEPPEGPVLATYFHYNDLRRSWPERFPAVHFAAIAPDPTLAERLERLQPDAGTVLLCERDERMAANIAADLVRVLSPGYSIESRITPDPAGALRDAGPKQVVLFSPRMWGHLPPRARADVRAVEVRYLFDPRDLERVAARLSWTPRGADSSRRPGARVATL